MRNGGGHPEDPLVTGDEALIGELLADEETNDDRSGKRKREADQRYRRVEAVQ